MSEETQLCEKVSNVFENVDCLINNAYYGASGHPLKMSNEDWRKGLEGTVDIYYRCIRDLISIMNAESSIINISSMYGMVIPNFDIYESLDCVNPISYGVGKAGVIHMTKYLANLLAKKSIRVNSVSPGAFPNESAQENKEFVTSLEELIPLSRIGKPEDLNGIISLLCSDESSYITGQNFAIDGGFTNLK